MFTVLGSIQVPELFPLRFGCENAPVIFRTSEPMRRGLIHDDGASGEEATTSADQSELVAADCERAAQDGSSFMFLKEADATKAGYKAAKGND